MSYELPAQPSIGLSAAFWLLGALAILFWAYAVQRAWHGHPRIWATAALALAAWAGTALLLASTPSFHVFGDFPPPALRLFAAGFVATVVIGLSPAGRKLARDLPLALLVGMQAFRLPVEIALAAGAAQGVVPPQMTWHGRNFDVLTALLAVPLAIALARGAQVRIWVWMWNLLGVGLLVNVVATAVLSMPGPMQRFTSPPANVWIAFAPFVWLPTLLVTTALLGHVLVFRRLLAPPTR